VFVLPSRGEGYARPTAASSAIHAL
jgi:hypothetical protein